MIINYSKYINLKTDLSKKFRCCVVNKAAMLDRGYAGRRSRRQVGVALLY